MNGLLEKLSKLRRNQTVVTTTVIILVLILIQLLHRPADFGPGSPGPTILFTVENGEAGTSIALNLQKDLVVKSSSSMIAVMNSSKASLGIAPGVHKISTHIPNQEAISQLLDQKRIANVIAVIPGDTSSDVLKKLHQDKSLVQQDLLSDLQPVLKSENNSLEGQLFPSQYSFATGTTTHTALVTMIKQFESSIKSTNLLVGYNIFSGYDVLKIASLIQIEADPIDYRKAARVIYNRLKIGMPLQLNSTVQYAAHLRGQISLSRNATKIDSPFNTYLHTGLPPTPISNPGLMAIKGAMNPEPGDWLYFITVRPHDTRFTKSFTEFEVWVELYNNNLANGAFK